MMQSPAHKKVVISAAYGMGNVGDEAICEAIVGDIFSINANAYVTILVFNKNSFFAQHPQWKGNERISVELMGFRKVSLLHPSEMFSLVKGVLKILFSDLFIWGGGGIIRNRHKWLRMYITPLRIAQFFRKNIIVWSIGVDKISSKNVIDLINRIKRVSYLSVRDAQSKINFLEVSRNFKEAEVRVVRDPVFHLRDFYHQKECTHDGVPRIGLNVSFWKADLSDMQKLNSFTSSLAVAIHAAYEQKKFSIVYLPTVPDKDNVVFSMLRKSLSPVISIKQPDVASPQRYMEFLSQLDLFIGMRLHSIILSSNVRSLSFLGIIYDEKVSVLREEKQLKRIWTIDEIIARPQHISDEIVTSLEDSGSSLVDFYDFYESSKEIKDELRAYLVI